VQLSQSVSQSIHSSRWSGSTCLLENGPSFNTHIHLAICIQGW